MRKRTTAVLVTALLFFTVLVAMSPVARADHHATQCMNFSRWGTINGNGPYLESERICITVNTNDLTGGSLVEALIMFDSNTNRETKMRVDWIHLRKVDGPMLKHAEHPNWFSNQNMDSFSTSWYDSCDHPSYDYRAVSRFQVMFAELDGNPTSTWSTLDSGDATGSFCVL